MKNKTLVIFVAIFLFIIASAYADNVVYIVQNSHVYDSNLVAVLEDSGFSVDIVNNDDVDTLNWGNYKFMLVNDDAFSNNEDIPVNDFPAVVLNTWNMNEWHWSLYMSSVSSSQPLQIKVIDTGHYITSNLPEFIQVYTTNAPAAYYLSRFYRASGLNVITSSTDNDLDATIATAEQGTILRNGVVSNVRTCWFGIIESDYWTNHAETLFKNCADWVAYGGDKDNDNIRDDTDNCYGVYNPGQEDADGDGVGDACDNCISTPNSNQEDADSDGIGDVCDICPSDALDDADQDGVCGDVDICEGYDDNADADSDGIPDGCDICQFDPNNDEDQDSVCGDVDNCPAVSNFDQADADQDTIGDACDICANDPLDDADQDGVCGDIDNCPLVSNLDQSDFDGDTIGDICDAYPNDFDNDGTDDNADNCPIDYNPGQEDVDLDGTGDVCDQYPDDWDNDGADDNVDNCPVDYNPDQEDLDQDGFGDVCDPYPDDHDNDGYTSSEDCDDLDPEVNPGQKEVYYNGKDDDCDALTIDDDQDSDGATYQEDCDDLDPTRSPHFAEIPNNSIDDDCDVATLDNDEDQDGVIDGEDNCVYDPNTDQSDVDGDGFGDVCDQYPNDYDNDAVDDGQDNCYDVPNTDQSDVDGDGIGDVCDQYPEDFDNDAVDDGEDNCYDVPNTDQSDVDGDGIGDACDQYPEDFDNDNVPDSQDNCYDVPNTDQSDVDGDGFGDVCDQYPNDFDNDGADDNVDNCPVDYNPDQEDLDQDGFGDVCDPYPDDHDNDGYTSTEDCDDADPEVNPGQVEVYYNGKDDDCDALTIDDDQDSDGATYLEDCDDLDPTRSPNFTEIPNNSIDDDCDSATLDNDEDQDGIIDGEDNCVYDYNPVQEDTDGDGLGNVCDQYPNDYDNDAVDDGEDNCYDVPNTDQSDVDGDGIGDACDQYPEDFDNDDVPDSQDNCYDVPNTDQSDVDGDGIGDVCDQYPEDFDNDGVDDNNDNCPVDYNPGQEDLDQDGIGDVCDPYPDDHDNDGYTSTEDCNDADPEVNPGQVEVYYNGKDDDCDALTIDNDQDSDGATYLEDCDDLDPTRSPNFSEIPNNSIDDDCDSATLDNDEDQDGIIDGEDNCVYDPNTDQSDVDGDGFGDVCDQYPNDYDNDGTDDDQDNCPLDHNPDQGDWDGDGIGDVCDEYPDDYDNDGYTSSEDCDDADPEVNPGQEEVYYNGKDDDCDALTIDDDQDSDGATYLEDCDDLDPARSPFFPETPNNGIDDDCNSATLDNDEDQDGIEDLQDNCVYDYNPGQEDADGDGIGDACDQYPNDFDNDGTDDDLDNCPVDHNPDQGDWDGDGIGDVCDEYPDDYDNDGYTSSEDCDDTDPEVNPGQEEVYYNGKDDDCDYLTIDDDQDSDGATYQEDCDDLDPTRSPYFQEIPHNGIDDDCDESTIDNDSDQDQVEDSQDNCEFDYNPGQEDTDGDGIGDACDQYPNDFDNDGYQTDQDCNDQDASIHPGAQEIMDNIDQNCQNDAPTLLENIPDQTWPEDTANIIDLAPYFGDFEGDSLTFSSSIPTDIDVTIIGSQVTLEPDLDWNGQNTIIFIAHDGHLSTDSNEVTLTVTPESDAPTLSIPDKEMDEDTTFTFDLDDFSHDVDSDPLTYTVTSEDISKVDCSIAGSMLTLTPAPNYNGLTQCGVEVFDGVYSNNDVFDITVNPINDAPVVDDIPDVSFSEGSSYVLDLNEYVDDVDNLDSELSWIVEPDPATLHFEININQDNFAIFESLSNWNGAQTIVFIACDAEPLCDADAVEVTITPTNDAPEIISTPILTALEDSLYYYDAYAHDIDGDILTYSLDQSPSGMSIDPVTGEITWIPLNNHVGTQSVIVKVDDHNGGLDYQTFDIEVENTNDWPQHVQTIPDQEWPEDEEKIIDIESYFEDVDQGDVLTYSASALSNIDVQIVGSVVTLTPDSNWNGFETIIFTVKDSYGDPADSNEVILTVTPVNDAPVLDLIYDVIKTENELVDIDPTAFDVEGDSLTFNFDPPLDENGEWQTDFDDSGVYTVTVTVTDNNGGSDSQDVQIQVLEWGNHPPELDHIDYIVVTEGDLVQITPSATDLDNDPLTYTFELPLDQNGEWQTGFTDAGDYDVNVMVDDGQGGLASQDVHITVLEWGNHAPHIEPISDIFIVEGDLIKVVPDVYDLDEDPLTITFTPPLDQNGEWQTGYLDAGDYPTSVGVSDGQETIVELFTIHVSESGNHNPILEHIDDVTVTEGELVKITPSATDPDDDPVVFSFTPPLDDFGEWLTEFTDEGTYTVTVTAWDGLSGFDLQEVTINVLDWGNHQPEIEPISDISIMEGELVKVTPIAHDIDGDVLTFVFSGQLDQNGEWQTNYMDAGTYTETVNVLDSRGGSASTTFTIDVLESGNHAPILKHIKDISVFEGELVEINVKAYDPDGDDITITFSHPLDEDGKWQTIEHETGVFEVKVTVSDGSLETTQTFFITVFDTPYQEIMVSHIRIEEYVHAGDLLEISVSTKNTGTKDIDNMRVTALIYELGAYGKTSHYDLEIGENTLKKLYLPIPEWAEPGEYEIRLTISSDEARRVKHRPIVVLG